jgi:hypothetical protein
VPCKSRFTDLSGTLFLEPCITQMNLGEPGTISRRPEAIVAKDTNDGPVTCVIVDGPYSGGINELTGDEVPRWVVALCDDNGDEVRTFTIASYEGAMELGKQIANDRRIELVIEAVRT